ncbi:DUF2795 domain-containing protein [Methanolobus sp.]|uniref:DUF2795 domain-containing protein n=1 Tax=Methanolobus sp. TaxID=1874737 RepID=UPI0025D25EFD|nr:DUF2795 domain-containing protein [Methanolobus sp.]
MNYPMRKHAIVDYVKLHNASDSIISNLQNTPDKAYMHFEEISKEFGSSVLKFIQQAIFKVIGIIFIGTLNSSIYLYATDIVLKVIP